VDRRTFVLSAAAACAAPGHAVRAATPGYASSPVAAQVREAALKLSRAPYAPRERIWPKAVRDIGYDQWRDIRLKPEAALWHRQNLGFEIQFFSTGYIYREPVKIFVAEDGKIREIEARRSLFTWGQLEGAVSEADAFAFSGFRVHVPRPPAPSKYEKPSDELAAFQGASYFRAVGPGLSYGLSARGLSLDTLSSRGEEFPEFTAFWIEKPRDPGAIVIHALLDSRSVAGAYRFTIRPGAATAMDIEAALFPRVDLGAAGVAPFSSMFWHGTHQPGPRDFRPNVHDSDGLLVLNAVGERLWRPLLNPSSVQVSGFQDHNPRGFGLFQRDRSFASYQDLEARQERRPSAWVEPLGDWGAGHVELIELPTANEYADNIVASWRPREPLAAGKTHEFAYRLTWMRDDPPDPPWLRVASTRIGDGPKPGVLRFLVDFEKTSAFPLEFETLGYQPGASGPDPGQWRAIEADLSATGAGMGLPFVQYNPHAEGARVFFDIDPKEQAAMDLRLSLRVAFETRSEVWIYRWAR